MERGAPKGPLPDTLAPDRNFTLSTEERMRAFVQGVPGWMRRRRQIEDLEARLVARVAALSPEQAAASAEIAADLIRLDDLIDKHNRYYPIEARLPIDVRTHRLMDRGRPWRPMAKVTLADLFARAHAAATG